MKVPFMARGKQKKTMQFENDGSFSIYTEEDLSQEVKRARTNASNFDGYKSEVANYVGTVPLIVLKNWCREHNEIYNAFNTHHSVVTKFLNHRDNSSFKAIPGKV